MIGKQIKKLRLERGLTQAQVAKVIGLTTRMVSFYENGERFPPNDILIKLSELFNVTTDYLLGIEKPLSKTSIERETNEWVEAFKEAGLTPADFKKMSDEQRKAILTIFKNFLND